MAHKNKKKKPKLPSVASLRRKAMKLWTDKVKDIQGRVCAICGSKDGADNGKGGRSWINAHHIEDRTNYALRWDVLNGIAVCPSHHEFGKDSFHRSPVWSLAWLKEHRPRVIDHVMATRTAKPQTADEYDRDAMMGIIAGLSMPATDEELSILGIAAPTASCGDHTQLQPSDT
jgi:hypothetical protein